VSASERLPHHGDGTRIPEHQFSHSAACSGVLLLVTFIVIKFGGQVCAWLSRRDASPRWCTLATKNKRAAAQKAATMADDTTMMTGRECRRRRQRQESDRSALLCAAGARVAGCREYRCGLGRRAGGSSGLLAGGAGQLEQRRSRPEQGGAVRRCLGASARGAAAAALLSSVTPS
jgi:hypothetical protein